MRHSNIAQVCEWPRCVAPSDISLCAPFKVRIILGFGCVSRFGVIKIEICLGFTGFCATCCPPLVPTRSSLPSIPPWTSEELVPSQAWLNHPRSCASRYWRRMWYATLSFPISMQITFASYTLFQQDRRKSSKKKDPVIPLENAQQYLDSVLNGLATKSAHVITPNRKLVFLPLLILCSNRCFVLLYLPPPPRRPPPP